MICAFCRREIAETVPEKSCGRCGGGCRKVHCPHCGYENPLPAPWVERLLGKRDGKKESEP